MLIFALLFATFSISSTTPLIVHDHTDPVVPLTVLGRELPECLDIKRFRTKYDIIWGCFVTIFACTWVSVHPNVPKQSHSGFRKLVSRISIMICALFTPEIITIWAMRQRVGAEKHRDQYNERFFPTSKPKPLFKQVTEWFCGSEDDRINGQWTLTHGFLLEMSGLKVDGDTIYDVSLLTKAVGVTAEEINDKSNSEFLTKLFAILQLAWFITQCIARWIAHLPVTELEVTTLGFAYLNIITYMLWWNKPQSIHVPVQARTSDEVDFCQEPLSIEETKEEKYDGSPGGRNGEPGPGLEEKGVQLLLKIMNYLRRATSRLLRRPSTLRQAVSQGFKLMFVCLISPFIILLSLSFVLGLLFLVAARVTLVNETHHDSIFYSSWADLQKRWEVLPACFVSMVFGGLHLIPIWTGSFPTQVEKILWQICAIAITAIPFIASSRSFVPLKFLDVSAIRKSATVTRFLCYFYIAILLCVSIAYVLARSVLILLSLIVLRDNSQDVYRNVVWSSFLPHF